MSEENFPENWNSIRTSGLKEYSKNHLPSAMELLAGALAEARKSGRGTTQEVTSLYDLAQLNHDSQKYSDAEKFYQEAERIAEKIYAPGCIELQCLFSSHGSLLREVGKNKEASELEKQVEKMANSEFVEQTIGAAEMKDDGTITLQLRAVGPGFLGDSTIKYLPTQKEYDQVLSHLGPLRPGQSKWVTPWK